MRAAFGKNVCALDFGVAMVQSPPMDKAAAQAEDKPKSRRPEPSRKTAWSGT